MRILIISLIFLFSCKPDYNYRVKGKVKTDKGLENAIVFTNELHYDGDTIYYFNSDSSMMRIYPPFVIDNY